MRWVLRPLARPATYGALGYAVAQLVLGVIGFTLLLAGWPITLVLAITPLVVPLLLGLRFAVGGLARAQAYLGSELLGVRVSTRGSSPAIGFWSRGLAVVRDRLFWKQQAHLLLAWPLALIPIALVTWAVELLTIPLWYRWGDSNDVLGFLDIDSFVETLPIAAVGLAFLLAAAHLLVLYALLSRWLALRLLSAAPVPPLTPAELSARRLRALTITGLVAAGIVAVTVVVWAATSGGYFWPVWPLLAVALVSAITGVCVLVLERGEITRFTLGSRALAIQVGVSIVLVCFLVCVWAVTSHGYFWPIWPALGLALLAAGHAAVIYGRRVHRIEELEESRAGAVDLQETELRRIERDLHDGAQARLVALGMSLGMAEEKLQTDPESARLLLAEARSDAREALGELRDLARGIRPPILTDRGLEAAIGALAVRSPLPVSLSVDVPERPAGAVETAAYFVVAEALANAIKHAAASAIDITVKTADGRLVAEVVDDGSGGADPAGGGLTGLRQRVGALDGTLRVTSPAGGPTTVRAELPCA
jgi:signal transduction histidine kinase